MVPDSRPIHEPSDRPSAAWGRQTGKEIDTRNLGEKDLVNRDSDYYFSAWRAARRSLSHPPSLLLAHLLTVNRPSLVG